MSVTTTSDERIDNAKENLQKAYNDLLACANSDSGWDDYNEQYQDTILESIIKVKNILRKL